ncbi:hypothetical protein HYFRA_00007111 [Hymenoscyphus fraxineus]|uniref:Uncharacterized protein n=1 Tax=Hymenoscyphus fraxineus TaxID=746836 RepID=A0A9N9KXX9_9HELO|nr:hypothetical protein HYFRA_00007111 [Hymenoscyphus fraxineus]
METNTMTLSNGERVRLTDSNTYLPERIDPKESMKMAKEFHKKNIFDVLLVKDTQGNPLRYEHSIKKGMEADGRKALRQALSTYVPEPLKLPFLLAQRDLEPLDYNTMIPGVVHCFVDDFVGNEPTLLAFAVFVTPEMTKEAGLWDGPGGLVELQEFFTRREDSKKGDINRVFTFGASPQVGHHSIRRSPDNKKATPETNAMANKAVLMGLAMLDKFLPEEHRRRKILERRWTTNASLTMADENNFELAAIQINRSEISTGSNSLSQSLPEFGSLHHDSSDEKLGFTVMYSLSNFPESYFPGRFNITAPRITTTLPTFSALIFKGVLSHFATGEGLYELENGVQYPKLSDDHQFMRLNIVCYPKGQLLDLKPKFVTPQFREDIQNGKAITSVFRTKRNARTWEMRVALLEEFVKSKTTDHIDPQEWCKRFSWINENGVEKMPELRIAQNFKVWAPEDAFFRDGKEPVIQSKEYRDVEAGIRRNLCGLRFQREKREGEEAQAGVDSYGKEKGDRKKEKGTKKAKIGNRVNPEIIWTHKAHREILEASFSRGVKRKR